CCWRPLFCIFFFSSRRRHTISKRDWSSDVCSSDLMPTSEASDYHEGLFMTLRILRKRMADERNVPPYVLFTDATLKDLCRYFPRSEERRVGKEFRSRWAGDAISKK